MFNVGIVAHLDRILAAEELADKVQAEYIAYDDGTLGCEANHRRVWEWHAEHPTDWAVVLEDDAEPVQGFRNQLAQALAVATTPIVSLYLGRPSHWGSAPQLKARIQHATTQAKQRGACWIHTRDLLHGVGIAIRHTHIQAMLTHTKSSDRPWDYAIRNWARDQHHDIAFTVPSLIDHADLPSLINHPDGALRTKPRKAWRTGARDVWNSDRVLM